MPFVRPLLSRTALLALILTSTGCELARDLFSAFGDFYNEPITLRVNLESPPKEVDVTDQVNAVEDELCSDPDGETCLLLEQIDKSDDGAITSPSPRVPDEFPGSITASDDMGNTLPDPDEPCDPLQPLGPDNCPPWEISVDEFLEAAGVFDAIDIKQAIPVDLTEEVSVSTPDAIRAVTIDALGLKYIENELTFATVPLDLYMTLEYIEEPDAAALLESGELTFVGTIEQQEALTSGVSNINFADDAARELFKEGLLNLRFTLVFTVPEGTVWTLADSPTTAGNKLKPQGKTELALVATLSYSVTPRELVGKAREAYDAQRDEIQANGGVEIP